MSIISCLQFAADDVPVHFPVDQVESIVECARTSRPPFGAPWLAGFALTSSGVLPCVRLTAGGDRRGAIKAVSARSGGLRFVVEIRAVRGFSTIALNAEGPAEAEVEALPFSCPPEWIRRGRDADARRAWFLDLGELAATLSGRTA